jgi:elongator complex protein 1
MWQEALSCAYLIPLPESELKELAQSLADTLVETRQFFEAATIYSDHLQDFETAARTLCKGYYFPSAIRLVSLRGPTSLLEDVIDPGLIEGSATMTELLAEMKTQLNNQIPRLRELRQKKNADPFAFYAGTEEGQHADIPDNISLAPTDATTSGGTFMTRYTRRTDGTVASNATRKTSKNRRREERKRARGKKGSVYEEEYLVSSVERLIERVNTVNEEVIRLVEGLMRRMMRERAIAVQAAMRDVVDACKACIPEVFGIEQSDQVDANGADDGGQDDSLRPGRGEGVLWDATQESRKKREPPIMKAFDGLSLLG